VPYNLEEVAVQILEFSEIREWSQFHSIRNLALALTGELGELVELIQWKTDDGVNDLLGDTQGRADFENEVADISIYLIRLCQQANINLSQVINEKLKLNEERFPVGEVRGKAD